MNIPSINPEALKALTEYLEARYPNVLPTTPTTIESIHLKMGNQQVIQSIKELIEYLEK